MIYTPMTKKAMQLAYDAHHGQRDKSDVPYIFHPIHLAEQMDDEISCCVALLHDTVEDTDVTLEQLRQLFPPEVTDAIALLTHREDTAYFDYVRAIRENPVAKKSSLRTWPTTAIRPAAPDLTFLRTVCSSGVKSTKKQKTFLWNKYKNLPSRY